MCRDYTVRFLCGCQPKPTTRPPPGKPTTKPRTTAKGATTAAPTTRLCPRGQQWDDCAYRCDRLCLAYGAALRLRGYCANLAADECVPGCVDEDVDFGGRRCPAGFFWRDEQTCVTIHDCQCRTWKGEVVAPGSVVQESACVVCQCHENV